MDRRDLFKTGAAITGGYALSGSITAGNVASLEAVTRNLSLLTQTIPARVMRTPVEAHLRLLEASMPSREALRRRVLVSVSRTADLLGDLEFYSLGRKQHGRVLYRKAIGAARESGDLPLYALALAEHGRAEHYVGERVTAVHAHEEATAVAVKHAPDGLTSHLFASHAEALAKTGDRAGTERALDLAHSLFDKAAVRGLDRYSEGFGWNRTRLLGYDGACYAHLGDGVKAEEAVRAGMAAGELLPSHGIGAVYVADLAVALVMQGRVEEGCVTAGQALDLAEGVYRMAADRVRALVLGPLRRYRSAPCVQTLQERLLASGA